MTTLGSGGPGPLKEAALSSFARTVTTAIIASEPKGISVRDDESWRITYPSPATPADAQKEWARGNFLLAVKYARRMFRKQVNGWDLIWAGKDKRYHVIAGLGAGRITPVAPPAALDEVDTFTTNRLQTQIRSRQQVTAAHGHRLVIDGTAKGDAAMVALGDSILDELMILSPRLHMLGADMGELADVARLVRAIRTAAGHSPKVARLLGKQAKQLEKTIRRLHKESKDLTMTAVALHGIYTKGALPPSP